MPEVHEPRHQLADRGVELFDHVAVGAPTRASAKLFRRIERNVRRVVGDVEEEGRAAPRRRLEEVERAIGVTTDEARLVHLLGEPPASVLDEEVLLVVAVGHAEELGEAVVPGHELVGVAEVPLADHGGAIAGVPQQLGDGDLAAGNPSGVSWKSTPLTPERAG